MTSQRWGSAQDAADDGAGPIESTLTPEQAFDDPGRFYSERLSVAEARAMLAQRLREEAEARAGAGAGGDARAGVVSGVSGGAPVEDAGTAAAARRQLAELSGAEAELMQARQAKEQWLVRRGGARGARLEAIATEAADAEAALAVAQAAQRAAQAINDHLEQAVSSLGKARRWDVLAATGPFYEALWAQHLETGIRQLDQLNAGVAGWSADLAALAGVPDLGDIEVGAPIQGIPIEERARDHAPGQVFWWPVRRWARATRRHSQTELTRVRPLLDALTARVADLEARAAALTAERIDLLRY